MIFEAERGSHMPETESPGLMNDRVRSLIGRSSPVREMYGTVDVETVRRYIVGIPDQDPRHWDPSAAGTRFGSTTTPAVMLHYIAGRQAPWLPDTLHDVMAADPFNDTGYAPSDEGDGLPSIRSVAATRSHLHAGDQIEARRRSGGTHFGFHLDLNPAHARQRLHDRFGLLLQAILHGTGGSSQDDCECDLAVP